MDKESVKKLYTQFEVASEEYDSYVDQFIISVRDGVVIETPKKSISSADFETIKVLRSKKNLAWSEYRRAFSEWVLR